MRRFYLQRNEGQAIVLAALAFVVLIGAAGLALDGAYAYSQRRNANNAADAAAMAGTRALLDVNQNGGSNSDVYSAVETYLNAHLPATGFPVDWHAYYIDGNGNQIGSAIPNNGSAVAKVDTLVAGAVRGVSVDVHYTFKTFFMPLLGRSTLTAAGYGLGLVGALGGATGPDLVPLAISDTAASTWQRSSAADKARIWSLGVYTNTTGLSYAIDQSDLVQVALKPGSNNPALGTNSSSCSGVATPADTLVYWWCKGTPYALDTKPTEILPLRMPPSSSLRDEILTRKGHDVLLPVYNLVNFSTGKVKIVGFLAMHVTDLKSSGTYNGVLTGTIISYYLAPGPISGGSSGFFDTYAINLVR